MTTTTHLDNTPVVPLWTTKDLAKFLGCSERQIPRLRDEGLPALYVGGLVRYMPCRVMTWLDARNTEVSDDRARQLADVASENDNDAAQCAAADLFREFPQAP